ncbi:SDR family NAD(P)-dependent oxidoreductase [Streptomyces phaeochromogenes]|uniref:SDR family oxidoreductase n=1 Tax=Streptomyces phaeochromogenes TaxID=1923 RepID=A0ABZ1H352_STRPH|nr:SDR family oxidoreductase [Streptomyces phaeochromogenes]WRZ27025.1 SDR family oxidoreductase [Streptomyces phaeochromogenes]WSD12590.1 SDR family oxidoreductase [Streptomyces phaeochromogenes]
MKVAIVTGASSGIGRSAAVQIAKRGVGVILTFSGNRQGGLDTVAAIEKEGGTAVALPLDVGESGSFPAFRTSVVDVLRDTWGRDSFDYLVNNAGFGQMAMFEDTTEELFDRFMRVLLKGPYFLTQTLLPLMADGGAVVNTTSNSAMTSGLEPGYSAYASMKGGLIVLTRYMAKEFSVRGIRVNAVAPGSTRTRISDDAFERFPEVIPALAAKTALGRVGESDDIGPVIASLLAEESGWITAQNIEVSGGYNL